MVWRATDPQCNESKKIVWEVVKYMRGRGLDLGAGDSKVLPQAISVDNMHHAQFGFTNKPDVMSDVSDLSVFSSQSMDWVFSSHALEHIQDFKAALREWWRVVKQSGYLILYLPHKDFYPNIGQPGANPDHKHDFLPEDIIRGMPDGWNLIECQERNNDMEYSMLLVFQKRNDKRNVKEYLKSNDKKTACVVRYGAFGDLMQSSSVWAALKEEDYHVTVFSSLPGALAVEHDPNIDELVLFDKDQVPNMQLGEFWAWQKKKFDKWVNLSESVEGTLLSLPGRTIHAYPPALRHELNNRNYTEFQHKIAVVPYVLRSKFYPTDDEKRWAYKERQRIGGEQIIVWSLAGSSVHKTWAGLDNAIAFVMLNFRHARMVLVGGPECVILEAGWENESRVIRTSGKWSIRQTLSFLPHANVIIGPETGVLNAAALLPMRKIVFLSHSTVENLTRDWVNTESLFSENTVCLGRGNNEAPACHQLHYGWSNCSKHEESGTAQCQVDISLETVCQALDKALSEVS